MDHGRYPDIWLRLPCDGVGVVTVKIIEYPARWAGDGLVEISVGSGGCAELVVKDGEGLEASLNVDVVVRDRLLGLNTGGNLSGIGLGHLDLGLVGSATEHLLEGGGCRPSHKCEDEAEGEGVEKDRARCNPIADHKQMLLDGGFEEVGEEGGPEVDAGG